MIEISLTILEELLKNNVWCTSNVLLKAKQLAMVRLVVK